HARGGSDEDCRYQESSREVGPGKVRYRTCQHACHPMLSARTYAVRVLPDTAGTLSSSWAREQGARIGWQIRPACPSKCHRHCEPKCQWLRRMDNAVHHAVLAYRRQAPRSMLCVLSKVGVKE